MKLISTFFAMLIIGITMNISAQNGPILTLGTVTTTGSTAIVPITVDNFINIKSCNLKISYDPAIGTPTGVTKGIGMNGTITLNLNTPGLIKLAWNAVTGGVSTLNDGSVLFNISFNKAGFGTSSLAFDESYDLYDCQFYSASYKALPDIPGTNYYFPGTLTFDSQMSPVTTAPMLTACSGANIDVPVTVSGFKNIGAVSLTLKYNPAVLNFNSGSNTGNFPGLSVGNQVPGTITIGGFSDDPNGYSLANESVLFTLSFTYNGGTSELKWFDDDGYSCQYANPLGESDLNDTPQATYYKNGSIGPCQTTPAPTIAVETISNPITCGGTGTISLTFTNVPNGTYAISYDGGSFSNVSVSGNAASITVPSGIYNNLKITVGGETSATGVNASLVNPTAPEKPTLEVTQPTCAVANGAVAITSPTSGLTFSTDGANYDAYTAPFVVAAGANYSITAKNMSGCVSIAATGTMGTELTAPEKPTLEVTQPTCAVANGAVAITSPTSGLTFSTDGANYDAYTAPFVVAAGANYSITAKNMSGCVSIAATGTMGTELTAPEKPTLEVTQPTCAVANGAVAITSPTSGLTFSTDGANYDAYTAPFVVAAGANYSITAKNMSGCVSIAATGTMGTELTAPEKPTLEVTQPTCAVANGAVAITSPTSGLTFSTDGANYAAYTAPFVVAAGANYSITAKNMSGCVSIAATGTMGTELTAPEKPTLEVTQPTCAVANGAVAITSPTSGLTFSTDGANYAAYTAPFVVAAGANYSITAKNMSGCVSIAATGTMGTELTAPEKPTLEVTQPTCAVANGAVAITSPTSGLTFSTDGANYAAYTAPFVVAAGANYSITAKNMSGCVSIAATGTMGTELTAPEKPTLEVTQPTCAVANGAVAITSPTSGLTFSTDGANYAAYTAPFVVAAGANYSITAKNMSGCVSIAATGTMGTELTAPEKPTLEVTQPTCAVANGAVAITSPTSGLTFSTDGANYAAYTAPFVVAAGANYSITAKNQSGCVSIAATGTMGTELTAPTVVSPSVTPSFVIGSGQVVFSASANTGTIKWFDSASEGLEVSVLNPIITSTTTYYAEAISPEGCISASRTAVTATVIPQGNEELSYRFANPRIYKINGQNYFEFDVQVKASEAGTSFQAGNIAMDFSNSTLSGNNANWLASPGPSFNGKYVTELMINGSVLNLDYKTANSTDLAAITTDYQTMATLSGKITTETGETGIDFSEVNMNGKQFYKLSTNPGYAAYKNINAYDDVDFADTYVGRIYAIKYGWTQIDNLNWNTPENTSVWEGDAIVPVANASNLRIHKPARLTIPTDGELTVNGNTDIQSVNGLIIESDATGTGSLITGTAFGLTTVQRYMTTDAWHIVSSPVSGQSISGFLSSNANIAISEDDSFRGMMDYNPVLNAWNDYFTNATGGSLTTGKGYCLRTNANSAVNFSGFIQAGTQSSTGLISESWNCIGNPYTSALGINNNSSSSSNFLDENVNRFDPSFGAIYVWDEPDESNGQYGKYTVISNASPAFEIQQGQAYLVKMKTGSTSVNFNSGMQLHNPGLALKSTKNVWPIITLEASVNAQKSSTTITFCEGMTKGLDPTYDAGLLKGGSDLIIYSRLVEDNGIPFAIQALPIQNIGNMIIPLGLDSKTGGEVVFSSELVNLPTDCKVILEDKELKTLTDLSLNVYKATIATNSVISDRFLLHVSALTTGTVNEKEGGLGAYAFRNTEMRVIGKVGDRAVASVFDIQGKLILIEKLNAGSINTVKLPLIKTGIYLLVVKDGENIQRFKVPVNEY